MKFSDVNIGDSFEFDIPDLDDDYRYVKVAEDKIKSYPVHDAGIAFGMEESVTHNVKNVGPAFETGRELRFPGGDNFVWIRNDSATGLSVTLEDVLNAGFANQPRFANMLVLPPIGEHPRVELVRAVKRIDENTLELAPHPDQGNEPYRVRVALHESEPRKNQYFLLNDKFADGELEMGWIHTKALERFLASEPRYANAKTLAEHEREYLAAKHSNQSDDVLTMSA